jgi:hypothetical protein
MHLYELVLLGSLVGWLKMIPALHFIDCAVNSTSGTSDEEEKKDEKEDESKNQNDSSIRVKHAQVIYQTEPPPEADEDPPPKPESRLVRFFLWIVKPLASNSLAAFVGETSDHASRVSTVTALRRTRRSEPDYRQTGTDQRRVDCPKATPLITLNCVRLDKPKRVRDPASLLRHGHRIKFGGSVRLDLVEVHGQRERFPVNGWVSHRKYGDSHGGRASRVV